MCSIVVNKELVSYIPRHLVKKLVKKLKMSMIFLCNNLPQGEGLLIDECPRLQFGKKYSENDWIIKRISVYSASSINDTIVIYKFK